MTFTKRKGRATFTVGKRGPRASYRLGCLLPVALVLGVVACSAPVAAPVATPVSPPQTFAPVVTDDPAYGTGIITFGTAFDPDTLQIRSPKSTFKRTVKKIAWSAAFSEPADTTELTLIIASKRRSGVEETLMRQPVNISNPDFDTLANAANLALIVDRKPGTYVMRYLRGSDVLAEGEFTLTR